MAFQASIHAWASAARPSGVSAPAPAAGAGEDPFQLSIHFCASAALAAASDLPPLEEPEEPEEEEEEESPPRVALAAKRPPRATTAASAPPEDACESVFLEDFFLAGADLEAGAGLEAVAGLEAEAAALGAGAVLPPLAFSLATSVPSKRLLAVRSGSTFL